MMQQIDQNLLQQATREAEALQGRPPAGLPFCIAARYASLLHPHTPSMGNPYPREHIQAERECLAFLLGQKSQQVAVKPVKPKPPKKVKHQRVQQGTLFEVTQ